jgi:hypothetical protein
MGGRLALQLALAGAGHAVHLEAAAAFTALVRTFLDQGKEDRCRSTG